MRINTEMLIRKLSSVAALSKDDYQVLANLPVRVSEIAPNRDVVREGNSPQECCLLIEGFMHRYQVLEDGTRQILAFHTPGDIPDLQSLALLTMDHSLAALVPSKIGFIPHASIKAAMRASPGIAEAFWRDTLIDAAIFRAWITSLGRRSAHGHLAHLLCEVFTRMHAVGLTVDGICSLPVTQAELADALGLSTVHANRTLMNLRRQGLIAFAKGRLTILDWARLAKAAQFDPAYLQLRQPAQILAQ